MTENHDKIGFASICKFNSSIYYIRLDINNYHLQYYDTFSSTIYCIARLLLTIEYIDLIAQYLVIQNPISLNTISSQYIM